MYLMNRDAELTPLRLGKIIQSFQTKELPKMKRYYNYYLGKQAILRKENPDNGREINRIVANFMSGIVDNYTGYLVGKDITYLSEKDNFELIQNVLNYNDVHQADVDLLKNACIYGKSAEIMWIDEDKQVRFKPLEPTEVIDVYDDTLERKLLFAIRFYAEDFIDEANEKYIVEVYSKTSIKFYRSTAGFSSFEFIREEPHYFGQVPITFLQLNNEENSIFDNVITLQDAFNTLLSSSIDDWEAFCDAFLVLTGGVMDEETLRIMKENRVILLDDADQKAEYLTKNTNDTQIQNLMKGINDRIHFISASPDFNDERFVSATGIAMKYKLIGFENKAGEIESRMRKALQRRIELICYILHLTGEEIIWRDVSIQFTRNLPINETEIAGQVNQLRGLVSDETLIAQLPFITDVDGELNKVRAEKEENMAMYNFNAINNEEDEEDE